MLKAGAQQPIKQSAEAELRNGKMTLKNTYYIPSMLGMIFWFFMVLQSTVTYLFFQNNPAYGTAVILSCTIAFCFVLLIWMLAVFKKNGALFEKKVKGYFLILFFCIWANLSIFWAPGELLVLFGYGSILLGQVITALVICTHMRESDCLNAIKSIVFASLIFSLIAFFAGTTADGRLGDSEFLHPNSIGNTSSLALIFSSYLYKIEKKFYVFVCIIIFTVLLLFSFSKTSIISTYLAIFISVFFFTGGVGKKSISILIAAFIFVVFSVILMDKIISYIYLYDGKLVYTITGRSFIWEYALIQILENPFWGYGLLSFRYVGAQVFSFQTVQAHNELLQIWFSYGVIGLFLLFSIYRSLIISLRLSLKNNRNVAMLTMSIIIYSLVKGVTEANVMGSVVPFPILIFTLLLSNIKKSRPKAQAQQVS